MKINQEFLHFFAIRKTPINLAPQESPLPLETMSQFTEPVIPDERRFAGRDPESSESDELRHSLLGGEGTCSYPAELS